MADECSGAKGIICPTIAVMGVTEEENQVYFTPTPERQIYEAYYLKALSAAGAEAKMIRPELRDDEICSAIQKCDGLLLVGGRDVRAERFHQVLHPKARLVPVRRDEADFLAYAEAKKIDMPVLGICRGAQVMGVANGGTLHQHLPDVVHEVDHSSEKEKVRHKVKRQDDRGPVRWPAEFETNTYHHQAVADPGQLRVLAMSADGVIEACYDPAMRWALGVQWHPELMIDEPFHRQIFADFLAACVVYRRWRRKKK
jgi:putative glutamine amidotransferase